jgi:hypothetical protein
MRLLRRVVPLGVLVLLAMAGGASAQSAGTPPAPSSPPGWQFSITPYAWLPGLTGTVQTPLPRVGDRSMQLGSGTVITDLSTVPVMVAGEARYGRFALVGDIFYAGLQQDIQTRDQLFQGGHTRLTSTIGTILGMVEVLDTPRQSLEVGAGTRIWDIGMKVSLNPGLLPGVIQKRSLTWADPLLAARYHAALSPAFGVSLYGDIGGFGAGSQLTWQAIGSVDYDLTSSTTLRAGWRYLRVDRTRGSIGVDVGFNGPFVAATFRF